MPRLIPFTQQEYNGLQNKMDIAEIVLNNECDMDIEPRVKLSGDILWPLELPSDLQPGTFVVVQKGVYEIMARIVVPYSEAGKHNTPGYIIYYAGVFVAGEFG